MGTFGKSSNFETFSESFMPGDKVGAGLVVAAGRDVDMEVEAFDPFLEAKSARFALTMKSAGLVEMEAKEEASAGWSERHLESPSCRTISKANVAVKSEKQIDKKFPYKSPSHVSG